MTMRLSTMGLAFAGAIAVTPMVSAQQTSAPDRFVGNWEGVFAATANLRLRLTVALNRNCGSSA